MCAEMESNIPPASVHPGAWKQKKNYTKSQACGGQSFYLPDSEGRPEPPDLQGVVVLVVLYSGPGRVWPGLQVTLTVPLVLVHVGVAAGAALGPRLRVLSIPILCGLTVFKSPSSIL